ncbi:MAG TPA: MbcA/ParS/Xre antitoxin family protein [Aquabacterium sp.]|nr:MbcA/ParS/Xre antitoxin family protein [Aquabacterium sp.]
MVEQIFTQAAEVFGSREAAEVWMSRPAIGLDRKRPLDCLHTEEGAQVVRDFLVRLDYCVYS